VAAFLDFVKEPLNDIGRADGLPMGLRKGIEGQTSLQVTLQTSYSGRINRLIFFDEGRELLVSFRAVVLIEDRLEFRST
jgi:hypothetical protein